MSRLSCPDKKTSDERIIRNLFLWEKYKAAESIFCYVGISSEIRTEVLFQKALRDGKRMAAPRCESNGEMTAREIRNFSELEQNSRGLWEPMSNCPIIMSGESDVTVIPCLACDMAGRRLGQGGGYYDRYLAQARTLRVALCRKQFLLPELPADPWDCSMDFIVSEDGVYRVPIDEEDRVPTDEVNITDG